jgi:hypothetical protein
MALERLVFKMLREQIIYKNLLLLGRGLNLARRNLLLLNYGEAAEEEAVALDMEAARVTAEALAEAALESDFNLKHLIWRLLYPLLLVLAVLAVQRSQLIALPEI